MKKIETFVAMAAASILTIGCEGFGPPPSSMSSDAGTMPADDAGERPRTETDGGMQMPPEVDAGTDVDRPLSGEECDPDRDAFSFENGDYACTLERCSAAYLACLGGVWRCVPDVGAICQPRPETDAGTPSVGTDAGPPAAPVDAGSLDYCVPGSFVGCWLDCGWPGHIDCDSARGYFGACEPFEGFECPTPRTDAGTPAPIDAGTDSGPPPVDAGTDAGRDAGTDAGTPATRTLELLFYVESSVLQSTSSLEFLEEVASAGATRADARPATCDVRDLVTEGGRTFFRCRMTRTLGAELFFVGRFRARASSIDGWSEGQTLATMSGWARSSCGSGSATAHVTWVIRDTTGRSLLNPDGLPDIVQPRGITEDGYPVCRGRIVF